MTTYGIGGKDLAAYLGGVSHSAVNNWANKTGPDNDDPEAFPYPDHVARSFNGKINHMSWNDETLPRCRRWMEKRQGWTPAQAEAFWAEVDANLKRFPHFPGIKSPVQKTETVPEGQLAFPWDRYKETTVRW